MTRALTSHPIEKGLLQAGINNKNFRLTATEEGPRALNRMIGGRVGVIVKLGAKTQLENGLPIFRVIFSDLFCFNSDFLNKFMSLKHALIGRNVNLVNAIIVLCFCLPHTRTRQVKCNLVVRNIENKRWRKILKWQINI